MKIAVVGSRGFTDAALLAATLSEYQPTEIVSGGARGADRLAADWANEHRITLK